ncbi:MAG TPA: baseplate J/gp47 family protein [Gemmataceae bacterium]|nr:baseplate J/gp47 family protein [Gemmataceae bacterium]
MGTNSKDRRLELLKQTTLNGIDFVEVANEAQTLLRVYFLNHDPALDGKITKATITGGAVIPTVKVHSITAADWETDPKKPPILNLHVDAPGDFSPYKLTLTGGPLDPYFASATFSFKARCPSTLDCAPLPVVCPPSEDTAPPIDYLAKDFLSFRRALLDFSALRYPQWAERSEADFGMMFLEALAALADDLSYTQDRFAAEATLETATQRRSLVRHARLVDYEPRPATAARVLLKFTADADGSVPSGLVVTAAGPEGQEIPFETGTGLVDATTGRLVNETFTVRKDWNQIEPYYWDDADVCLRAGATSVWVKGDALGFQAGDLVLLDTPGLTTADPPRRAVVHLVSAIQANDPLYGEPLTLLTWRAEDALTADHDLRRTHLHGNLVPAVQGRRALDAFVIAVAPPSAPGMDMALARTGANGSTQYLHTLREAPLAWLAPPDGEGQPLPEIHVEAEATPPVLWPWRRSLLLADRFNPAYTLDPVRYRPAEVKPEQGIAPQDYDGDAGDTLRFGDGVFGPVPPSGTVFRVTYRVGGGTLGNVAADAITRIAPGVAGGIVSAVTNPLPATGGAAAEPAEQIQRLAPEAFRARQFRAVRAEDYEEAAQSLPWVQRAGTRFRWTGSWLTVFTVADPKGSTTLPPERQQELVELLNRRRLAGYESYVAAPVYAALDLKVRVCVHDDAFQGDVERGVLARLSTAVFLDGSTGFFHPDRFTFGTPLERSALEAAVQSVPGVAGVISICYRRRGHTSGYVTLPETIQLAPHEILIVDNDPSRPERGSVRVYVEGGK